MRRGDLSNQPAPICAVDFKVLIESKYGYGWFKSAIPGLLLRGGFESTMKASLPWKQGALMWLERNWERRFMIISVAVPDIVPAIDIVALEKVAETEHFSEPGDLRTWMLQTPEVYRLITNDPALLGLDDIIRPFGSWADKA